VALSCVVVGHPERHILSKEVDASFGRMPNIHQSGETDHPGAIARIADAPVGAALFEVALTG
jgi:hypothetical protein